MDLPFNFKLNPLKTLSSSCTEKGLIDFASLCHFVQQLPYGRNTNRSDYTSIFNENKGTCSTKHAFLKEVAIENHAEHIKLKLSIYKMNEHNTKGIGLVLNAYNLDYIPEAHTYIMHNNTIYDLTRIEQSDVSFANEILYEEDILPDQIADYKVNFHKKYINNWLSTNNIPYSFKEIWDIREACIAQLSL